MPVAYICSLKLYIMKHSGKTISLLVIFSVVVLNVNAQQKELSAEQMLQGKSSTVIKELPKLQGWKDDTHFILSRPGEKGADTVLVDAATGKEVPYTTGTEKKAVVSVKKNDVIYTGIDGVEKQLTSTREEEKNPTLSPDGTKVAFTRNNDLYVVEVQSGVESRLTTDGSSVIYNGYASWVYFEEILGRASRYRAFWWSPDSKQIAYMRFDDSKVPVFPIYGADGQHGYVEYTRYPKAGDKNPEVKVGVVALQSGKTVWSDFNEQDDQYFGTPFWTPDGSTLWVQWMNRDQNHLVMYAVNPTDGTKKVVYEEQQKTWVDWLEGIHFLQGNQGFIIQSDKSGWMHLYHFDMQGKLVKQITNGAWTVRDIVRVDEKKAILWFTARKENSARFDLYSVKLDGTALQRMTFGDYTHNTNLSPNGSYFITTYSNVSTPPAMALVETKTRKIKLEIADSKGAEYASYLLAKTQLLRVPTADGFQLPVTITWPLHMDSSKKYPVLISIYGGPNAGTVYDGWKGVGQVQWWAKEGLIQVAIDHRGSGHFGKVGQDYMYKDLGKWELNDYSAVVQWLREKSYIDSTKICITGFSYGGFMTSLALTRGAGLFTHGIAGGSVVDWKLYDSHYTERFMGTPANNPEGYKNSSVLEYVDNYKGNIYIVHGTMDDNVHMQNSIQLIGALQDKKKTFEFMLYPGGRHGWSNLKDRWAHFNNEKAAYYYKYLLGKPMPKEVLQ